MHAVLKLIYRYITKNKGRCILIGFCIMMSAALIYFMQLSLLEFNRGKEKRYTDFAGGNRTCSVFTSSKNYMNNLKNIDIVKNVSCALTQDKYFNIDGFDGKFVLVGFEDNIDELVNFKLTDGRYPTSNNEIALEKWVVDRINIPVKIGDSIKISLDNYDKEFLLTGIYEYTSSVEENKNIAIGYITLESSEDIFAQLTDKTENKYIYECYIETKTTSRAKVEAALHSKEVLFINYTGMSTHEAIQREEKRGNNVVNILSIFVILAAILTLYSVLNSSANIKSPEFGMLKAIGMTDTQIRGVLIGESLILGIVFIGVGIIIGNLGYKIVAIIVKNIVYSIENINTEEIVYTYVLCLPAIVLSSYLISIKFTNEQAINQIKGNNNFDIDKSIKNKVNIEHPRKFIIRLAKCNAMRNKSKFKGTVRTITVSMILIIIVYYLQINLFDKQTNNYSDFVIQNLAVNENYQISENEIKEISQINGIKSALLEKVLYQFINMSTSSEKLDKNGLSYIDKSLKSDKLENANEYKKNKYYYMLTQIKEYRIEDIEKLKPMIDKGIIDNNIMQNKPVCILVQNINDNKVTKYTVGDKISITSEICRKENGNWVFPAEIELTIGAILNEDDYECSGNINTVVIISSNVAQKYLNKSGYYKRYAENRVKIDIKNKSFFDEINTELESIVNKNRNLQLFTSEDLIEKDSIGAAYSSLILYSLMVAFCICCLLSTFCIMFMNIILRNKEYALFKAVGMTDKQLKKLILTESYIFGLTAIKRAVIGGSICIFLEFIWLRTDILCIYPLKFIILISLLVLFMCFLATVSALRVINKDEVTTAIQAVE